MTLEQDGKPVLRAENFAESSNQPEPPNISLVSNYLIDDFSAPDGWASLSDKDTPEEVTSGDQDEGIFRYSLDKGIWTAFQKSDNLPVNFTKGAISLEIKPEGDENMLTVKLIDQDGSVFGWSMDMDFKDYRTFSIKPSDLKHLWGGDDDLGEITRMEITIDKKEGGTGTVRIRNLRYLASADTGKK